MLRLSHACLIMTKQQNPTLHDQLILKAGEHGWKSGKGWKNDVRQRLSEKPWSEDYLGDVLDLINVMPCIPDAWRFVVESEPEGWSEEILVIQLLEVEVTNPVSQEKQKWYERLWWSLDSTAYSNYHSTKVQVSGVSIFGSQ
jgi:hypothetical protein